MADETPNAPPVVPPPSPPATAPLGVPPQPPAGPSSPDQPAPARSQDGIPDDTDKAAQDAQDRRAELDARPLPLGLQPPVGQEAPPGYYPDGAPIAPAPEPPDPNKPRQFDGTDKNVDDPANANPADIADAIADGPWESAPQPFRKRDGFPDLTSESVQIRFDRDYYPADPARFQSGGRPRALAGELWSVPSDEAIAVIEAGIGHREMELVDNDKAEADQRKVWKERDEDAQRAKDEAQKRRDDDGA
jgi:hypothetical protein